MCLVAGLQHGCALFPRDTQRRQALGVQLLCRLVEVEFGHAVPSARALVQAKKQKRKVVVIVMIDVGIGRW